MKKVADIVDEMGQAVTSGYKKVEDGIVSGYKKIESGVVSGYKKIENGAVSGFEKVSDKCVDVLFAKDGETAEEAKTRLSAKKESRN